MARCMFVLSRYIVFSLVLTIIFAAFPSSSLAVPQIQGKAAALIDSKSGEVLFGINENTPLPPASTTKIMTAILAIEKTKPSDIVIVGKNPANPEICPPSAIGLKEGERITMENLLYALLIKSANDAAVAIAEHISGSVPEFTKLMNQRAKEWGATNTNFVNPNGLPDPNHYSTARDLALIAKHVMENSYIREIVKTKNKTIPREDDTAIKWLPNHNKLLWQYEGANGVKTGYTREAKQCLVSSAARDDREFIAVVLGAVGSNVWSDSKNVLDYGFDNFLTVKQKAANQIVKQVPVSRGTTDAVIVTQKDFYYTVPKDKTVAVMETTEINGDIKAPVRKGQVLGRIKFSTAEKQLGFVNLVAQSTVPAAPFLSPQFAKGFPVNPQILAAVFLVLFIGWNIKKRRRKNRRRSRWWPNRNGIR